jgi:hypothetical protein
MIDPAAQGLVPEGFGRPILKEAERQGTEIDCLGCHSTAFGVPENRRAATFHMEDGVQCEACHGPGGHHIEAAAKGEGAGTIARGNLESCAANCHRHKPSHAPFIDRDFVPQKAWAHIAHE